MMDLDKKIQDLVSEILSEIKNELKARKNKIKINPSKNRVEIGSYKGKSNDAPVLTEIVYDSVNDIVYVKCNNWIDYLIHLKGDLENEPNVINVGKIDYIDYINIYKAIR